MEWIDVKPEFKENCVLVTATLINSHWDYASWIIEKVNHGDGEYLSLLVFNGEEWGDIDDLTADKYLILPPL